MSRADEMDSSTPESTTSRSRRILFSLAPAAALFLVLELTLRVLGIANPAMGTLPLPEEYKGLFEPDDELFWRLRPNLDLPFKGARIHTGPLGLRVGPLGQKQPGEFRVLSLGESTTFGVGVADDLTYSARLEQHLAEWEAAANPENPRAIRVINAGVPAYSSFQSLHYLKRRGLALEPDLVLFYHELNDYLPSSLRDSSNNEMGLSRSDPELYRSRRSQVDRWLLSHWALYRWLVFRRAQSKIARLQATPPSRAPSDIGLPNIGIRARTVDLRAEEARFPEGGFDEEALPPRVRPAERLAILSELADFCRAKGIALAILHPAYRESMPHECELTHFCARSNVAMFEVQPVLHPHAASVAEEPLYIDRWHPSSRGHALLARRLSSWLVKEGLHRSSR